MKRFVAFLSLATMLAPILVGCGSSSSSNGSNITVPPRYVPVSVTVQWQALPATRAVTATATARSARLFVTDLSKTNPGPDDVVPVAIVNRHANINAYVQTIQTSNPVARPERHIDAQLQFFSGMDGTGTLLGIVKKSSTLPDSGDLGEFNSASGKATPTE